MTPNRREKEGLKFWIEEVMQTLSDRPIVDNKEEWSDRDKCKKPAIYVFIYILLMYFIIMCLNARSDGRLSNFCIMVSIIKEKNDKKVHNGIIHLRVYD